MLSRMKSNDNLKQMKMRPQPKAYGMQSKSSPKRDSQHYRPVSGNKKISSKQYKFALKENRKLTTNKAQIQQKNENTKDQSRNK